MDGQTPTDDILIFSLIDIYHRQIHSLVRMSSQGCNFPSFVTSNSSYLRKNDVTLSHPKQHINHCRLVQVEIQNYIGIRYYFHHLLVTSFFHCHNTAKYVDEQLRRVTLPCNRKINARNINIEQFSQLISSRRLASWQRFSEGRFITTLSCSFPTTSPDEKQ